MNGATLLVKCLESEDVQHIWGYPGGAIMPVYDALLDSSITHYLTRHEQGAGFAAQGFARSSGKVGVCLVTSGPGATNVLTAIADAQMDSVPLVVISGQVPTQLIGTDGFQEADIFGLSLPICKHSFLVKSADEIPSVVREAFQIANSGRPGPVLIDFPKDLSLQEVESAKPLDPTKHRQAELRHDATTVDPAALDRAMELLKSSSNPVIYAGGGLKNNDSVDTFRRFVRRTQIPVVHTLHGLGGLPAKDPLFLGMLGMHGNPAANFAVQNSDLLIVLGARFDDRATGRLDEFAPNAKVIHVDIDCSELGKLRKTDVSICCDLNVFFELVNDRIEESLPSAEWSKQCGDWRQTHASKYDVATERVSPQKMLNRISELATNRTIVCSDVGQHQMWVAQHFGFQSPLDHLSSGGLGTMGFGLPAAIGAKTANPSATVIAVSGDGSIMMNLQELATIKRYNLPVKILLFDNSALGMVRQWQEVFFDNRESEVDLSDNPDFAKIAEAFGIPAITLSSDDRMEETIQCMLYQSGPLFVHVPIERGANVWPLVPPGKNNAQMIHNN